MLPQADRGGNDDLIVEEGKRQHRQQDDNGKGPDTHHWSRKTSKPRALNITRDKPFGVHGFRTGGPEKTGTNDYQPEG
jgi:hypothetical protein